MSNEAEWNNEQGVGERAMRSLEKRDLSIETENEIMHGALKSVLIAMDVLIDERPMLAAKVCGSTTLGNLRVNIKAILDGDKGTVDTPGVGR